MALTDEAATSLLSMWVIYDHPLDMPEHNIVARRHEVHSDVPFETKDVLVGRTLQAVRDQLPRGLSRFPRDPTTPDDPKIIEVWL